MYALFLRSSRIYLTEVSIPPDYINHHSSNSIFFEAEKVLLQQQRTRTPGPRNSLLPKPGESPTTSTKFPECPRKGWRAKSWHDGSSRTSGGYKKCHGVLLTTYSTVLDAHMWPYPCSSSGLLFHSQFSCWASVQPGVCVRPSPNSTWGWSPTPGKSFCLLPQGKRLGRRFQWLPGAVLDIILLTVCSAKITSTFHSLEALADMPQCWNR